MDNDRKASFSVKLSEPGLVSSRQPTNSFALQGDGEIALQGDRLALNGKWRRAFNFAKDLSLDFPVADVRNVLRVGKLVRFEVPSLAGSPHIRDLKKGAVPFITTWARNEAEAVQLAAALGEVQTPDFAQAVREQSEFQQRLQAATPVAWVTPVLVGINVLVFVLMAFDGAGVMKPEGDVHVRWGSNYGILTASGEWWRLFTSMFLHFGLIHIALNMATLWDIGRTVERLYGNWTFLLLYLLSGVSGSVLSLLWHPQVNSAGASGAIFGVFGMLAAFMSHKELGVPTTVMKSHWRIALPFIGYNLFIGATVPGIDNAAHLGGLAGGFVMGYALARPLDASPRAFSRGLVIGLVALLAVGAAAAALGLKGVSARAQGEMALHTTLETLAREDTRTRHAVEDVITKAKAGQVSPDEASRKIQQEAVTVLDGIERSLSSIQLDPASNQRARRDLVQRYVVARKEGYAALAEAIRTDDPALAKRARDRFTESGAIVKELENANRR